MKQRDKNPDHVWSEADTNDAPTSVFAKAMVAKEAKVCLVLLSHPPEKADLYSYMYLYV